MSAKFSQLRELARQYSAGQMARDDYRSRRTALLGEIASGKTSIEYREITPPKPAAPTVVIDVGEDEPEVRRLPIILGAILVVVSLGAGGFFYLRAQTAVPTEVRNVAPQNPAVQAAAEFMRTKDWSSAGMAAFEARLAGLGEAQVAAAHQDGAFALLERELRSRIEDQKALASLDPAKADAEIMRLRAFADRIGVRAD
jgi:hypothetical protein